MYHVSDSRYGVDDRSYITGLGNDKSDIDICIYNPNAALDGHLTVNEVADFLTMQQMERVMAIPDAKVPIVRFVDPSTRIACDMNIQHTLGIYNSMLIKAYLEIDERVGEFLALLKHFAKNHKIHDASVGYLSSYAYNLMGIVFLQQQNEAILPRLQSTETRPRLYNEQGKTRKKMPDFGTCLKNGTVPEIQVNEAGQVYNCSFDNRISAYKSYGFLNKKTVGQLLFEFFEYFSRRFDYRTMEVSALAGRIQERQVWEQQRQLATGSSPTTSTTAASVRAESPSTTVMDGVVTSPSPSSSSGQGTPPPTWVFDAKRKVWLSPTEQMYLRDLEDHGGLPSGKVPIPGVASASALIAASNPIASSTLPPNIPIRPIATPRGGPNDPYLCVMDPFIPGRNVAGTCRGQRLIKVWRSFDHAYKCMGQGKFAEAFHPLDSDNV